MTHNTASTRGTITSITAVEHKEKPATIPKGATAFMPEDIEYAKTVLDQISQLARTEYDNTTHYNFLGYLATNREKDESVRDVTDRALKAAQEAETLITRNIEPGVEITQPSDHDFIRQAFFANGPFEAKTYANYAAIKVLQGQPFDIGRPAYYKDPFPTLVMRDQFDAKAQPAPAAAPEPDALTKHETAPNRPQQSTGPQETIEVKPQRPSSTTVFNQRCHDLDEKLTHSTDACFRLRMQIEHAKTTQEDMLMNFGDYGLVKIDDALDPLRDLQKKISLLEEIQDDLLTYAQDDAETLQTWTTARLVTLRQALSAVYKAHNEPNIDVTPTEPRDIQTNDLEPYKTSRSTKIKDLIQSVKTTRTEEMRLEAELKTIQAQNALLEDGRDYVAEQIAAINTVRQSSEAYAEKLEKDNADLGAALKKAGAFDQAPAHDDETPTAEQPTGAALTAG